MRYLVLSLAALGLMVGLASPANALVHHRHHHRHHHIHHIHH